MKLDLSLATCCYLSYTMLFFGPVLGINRARVSRLLIALYIANEKEKNHDGR